jgi:hypothetical protein
MWHHCFRNDRWQSYFQQPGLAVWASVQPISLRCLCTQVTFRFSFTAHLQLTTDLNCIYNTLLKRRTRDKHSSLFGWITSKKKFFWDCHQLKIGQGHGFIGANFQRLQFTSLLRDWRHKLKRYYCKTIKVKEKKLEKRQWKVRRYFIRPTTRNSFNWTQALMSLAFLVTFVSVTCVFNNFDVL